MKLNGLFALIPMAIVAATYCLSGAEPAEKETESATATAKLAQVKTFAFGGVGVAGTTSPSEYLFRQVLTGPNATANFHTILTSGTPEAKLYALTALHSLEPASFTESAAPLKKANPTVETIGGCIIMKLPAASVLTNISKGNYDAYLDKKNWRH